MKRRDAAFKRDILAMLKCDAIFGVINGTPPDPVVSILIGIAIGANLPYFLFRDDTRVSTDCEELPANLMFFSNLPEAQWRKSFYFSLEEIPSKNKMLHIWLNT